MYMHNYLSIFLFVWLPIYLSLYPLCHSFELSSHLLIKPSMNPHLTIPSGRSPYSSVSIYERLFIFGPSPLSLNKLFWPVHELTMQLPRVDLSGELSRWKRAAACAHSLKVHGSSQALRQIFIEIVYELNFSSNCYMAHAID